MLRLFRSRAVRAFICLTISQYTFPSQSPVLSRVTSPCLCVSSEVLRAGGEKSFCDGRHRISADYTPLNRLRAHLYGFF